MGTHMGSHVAFFWASQLAGLGSCGGGLVATVPERLSRVPTVGVFLRSGELCGVVSQIAHLACGMPVGRQQTEQRSFGRNTKTI